MNTTQHFSRVPIQTLQRVPETKSLLLARAAGWHSKTLSKLIFSACFNHKPLLLSPFFSFHACGFPWQGKHMTTHNYPITPRACKSTLESAPEALGGGSTSCITVATEDTQPQCLPLVIPTLGEWVRRRRRDGEELTVDVMKNCCGNQCSCCLGVYSGHTRRNQWRL